MVVVVGAAVVEVVVGALVVGGAAVVGGAGSARPPPAPQAAATTPSATRAAKSGARRARCTERGGDITLSVAEAPARSPWGERPACGHRAPAAYGVDVADESTTTTVVIGGTSTTLVGPNGTAPGMGFVQQQQKPLDDSTTGRGTGLPLAIAALVILVVFTTILVKAWRNRGPRSA